MKRLDTTLTSKILMGGNVNLLEIRINEEYSTWLTQKYTEYEIDNSLTK